MIRQPDDNICGRCNTAEYGCEGLCIECEKSLRTELNYAWESEPHVAAHDVPRYIKVYCPLTKTYKTSHFIQRKIK